MMQKIEELFIKRSVQVKTVYTPDEVKILDGRRGKMSRGAYCRASAIGQQPVIVPEINRIAWFSLSKVTGNLATIASFLRSGRQVDITEIRTILTELRNELIGARTAVSSHDIKKEVN